MISFRFFFPRGASSNATKRRNNNWQSRWLHALNRCEKVSSNSISQHVISRNIRTCSGRKGGCRGHEHLVIDDMPRWARLHVIQINHSGTKRTPIPTANALISRAVGSRPIFGENLFCNNTRNRLYRLLLWLERNGYIWSIGFSEQTNCMTKWFAKNKQTSSIFSLYTRGIKGEVLKIDNGNKVIAFLLLSVFYSIMR